LSYEDWYDLAAIGLCKAAMTFKEDIANFSTYAYRCMFNSVIYEKRKEKQAGTIPAHQIFYYESEFEADNNGECISFINTITSKDDVEGSAVARVIFEDFIKNMKPRDRIIFRMFQLGYKQREIGQAVGCSQAQVSRVKKKLEKYLSV